MRLPTAPGRVHRPTRDVRVMAISAASVGNCCADTLSPTHFGISACMHMQAAEDWIAFVRGAVEPDDPSHVPLRVLTVGAAGRPLLVPGLQCPLLPPHPLPERRASGSPFTGYHIVPSRGRPAQRVPRYAVVRDYRRAVPAPACVRAAQMEHPTSHVGTSAMGWSLPEPYEIIVLAVRRSHRRVCYGWFVRWIGCEEQVLRKVPSHICILLNQRMVCDVDLRRSSLVTKYPDSDIWWRPGGPTPNELEFVELASRAFARDARWFKTMPPSEHARKRARHAPVSKTDASASASSASSAPAVPMPAHASVDVNPLAVGTCVVCLDEKASAAERCRSQTCKVLVCDRCHAKTRGMCPLCDRGNINADFLCAGCGRIEQLSEFGLPCVRCKNTSLCRSCYDASWWCASCGAI